MMTPLETTRQHTPLRSTKERSQDSACIQSPLFWVSRRLTKPSPCNPFPHPSRYSSPPSSPIPSPLSPYTQMVCSLGLAVLSRQLTFTISELELPFLILAPRNPLPEPSP